MSEREKKLEILKKRETIKNFQITGNGEAFVEILEATVNELKDSLGAGVELKNLDDLLEQLGVLQSFQKEVKDLKDSIKEIKLPDNIEVRGLGDLVKATKVLSERKDPEFKIDEKLFKELAKSIVELTLKVEEASVPPKQNQKPSDYVPMRRVMKVGNKLMYDDSFYTGGGGGSSSTSSGSSGGGLSTNDGTFATPAKQDTGNTSLGTIATNTSSTSTNTATTATNTGTIAGAVSGSKMQSNMAQVAGTAVSVNAGTVDNGTQRSVLTNDYSSTVLSKLTDGTNTASVVAGDTGFNGVATAGVTKTYPFTTSTPGAQTLLANTVTEGFAYVTVIATSVGSGLAWQGQFSPNTGGTYISATTWTKIDSFGQGASALGTSVNTHYISSNISNYFQLNVTALTSGTLSGYVILSNSPHSLQTISATQSGTWTVGSNSATGSAVPANAFYAGMLNSSGNLAGLQATSAGDALGSAAQLAVGLDAYNGATWDRVRSANGASNTTGTGLLGAGQMVWDGTNWQKQRADTSGVPTVNAGGVAGTALVPYSVRLTTNTTTTPTSSTAYISSLAISTEVVGTTSTVTVQDKQGTPLKLVPGLTSVATGLTVYNFQTPVKMVSGIDIVTAGAVAATVDVFMNYYQ